MKISKVHQDAKDALALVREILKELPNDTPMLDAESMLQDFIVSCVEHEDAEAAMEPVGHDVYKEQMEESA